MRGELTIRNQQRPRRRGATPTPAAPNIPMPTPISLARQMGKAARAMLISRISQQLPAYLDDLELRLVAPKGYTTFPAWPKLRFAVKDEWNRGAKYAVKSSAVLRALNAALIARDLGDQKAYYRATDIMGRALRRTTWSSCGWWLSGQHADCEQRFHQLIQFADSSYEAELPALLNNMGSKRSLWNLEMLTHAEQFQLKTQFLARFGHQRRTDAELEDLAAGMRKYMASHEPKAWGVAFPPMEADTRGMLRWMLMRAARGSAFDADEDSGLLYRALRNNGLSTLDRSRVMRPLLLSTQDAQQLGKRYMTQHVDLLGEEGDPIATLEGLRSRFEMASSIKWTDEPKQRLCFTATDAVIDAIQQRMPNSVYPIHHRVGRDGFIHGVRIAFNDIDAALCVMRPAATATEKPDIRSLEITSSHVFDNEVIAPQQVPSSELDDMASPCRHPQASWIMGVSDALALTHLCPECGAILGMKPRHLLDDTDTHAVPPSARERYLTDLQDRATLLDDRSLLPTSWDDLHADREAQRALAAASVAAAHRAAAAPTRVVRPRLRA